MYQITWKKCQYKNIEEFKISKWEVLENHSVYFYIRTYDCRLNDQPIICFDFFSDVLFKIFFCIFLLLFRDSIWFEKGKNTDGKKAIQWFLPLWVFIYFFSKSSNQFQSARERQSWASNVWFFFQYHRHQVIMANSNCDSHFHNRVSRYHKMGWLQYI